MIILAIDLFFFLDIFFNFRTTYRTKGEEVFKYKRISRHYAKTWLPIDLIANIPFDLMIFLISIPFRIIEAMAMAAPALVGWITDSLVPMAANFLTWVSDLWVKIATFIIELPGKIGEAVTGLTQWISDAIPVMGGNMTAWVEGMWGKVTSFISNLPGQIFGAIAALTNWITESKDEMITKFSGWAIVFA